MANVEKIVGFAAFLMAGACFGQGTTSWGPPRQPVSPVKQLVQQAEFHVRVHELR